MKTVVTLVVASDVYVISLESVCMRKNSSENARTGGAGGAPYPNPGSSVDRNASSTDMSHCSTCLSTRPLLSI